MASVAVLTARAFFQSTGAPSSSRLLASLVFPALVASQSALAIALASTRKVAMLSDERGGGQALGGTVRVCRRSLGLGNRGRARRPQCSFKSGPRIQDSQRPRACQPAAPVSGMRRTCYDEHCHCSTLKPLQRACFGMPLCCNPGRAKTARQSRVHGASGSRRARDKSIGLATG